MDLLENRLECLYESGQAIGVFLKLIPRLPPRAALLDRRLLAEEKQHRLLTEAEWSEWSAWKSTQCNSPREYVRLKIHPQQICEELRVSRLSLLCPSPLCPSLLRRDWHRYVAGIDRQVQQVFLTGCPIVWKSEKQTIVTISTTEAEFINLTPATLSLKWVAQMCADAGYPQPIPLLVHTDSQNTRLAILNPLQTARIRHIDIRYKWINQEVAKGGIILEFVGTVAMKADGLMKSLRHRL